LAGRSAGRIMRKVKFSMNLTMTQIFGILSRLVKSLLVKC